MTEDYRWDCIDSEITELPELVSWCDSGVFQTVAHVNWDIVSILNRAYSFLSQPDLITGITAPVIYGYDQFFPLAGSDQWHNPTDGDEWFDLDLGPDPRDFTQNPQLNFNLSDPAARQEMGFGTFPQFYWGINSDILEQVPPDYYIDVKIPASEVPGGDTYDDFPITIYINARTGPQNQDLTDIFRIVGGSWQKIYFTIKDTGQNLYAEVESWDTSDKRSGIFHVRVPSGISSSDDLWLRIIYEPDAVDNPLSGSINSSIAQNVWVGYRGVYHMKNDGGPTNMIVRDSTSNNRDFTHPYNNGWYRHQQTQKRFIYYNGGTQAWALEGGDRLLIGGASIIAIEAMVRPTVLNRDSTILSRYMGFSGYNAGAQLRFYSANRYQWRSHEQNEVARNREDAIDQPAYGKWDHVVGWYWLSNRGIMVNGVNNAGVGAVNGTGLDHDDWPYSAGARIGSAEYDTGYDAWVGDIAEIRVHNVQRTEAWFTLSSKFIKDQILEYDIPLKSKSPEENYRQDSVGAYLGEKFSRYINENEQGQDFSSIRQVNVGRLQTNNEPTNYDYRPDQMRLSGTFTGRWRSSWISNYYLEGDFQIQIRIPTRTSSYTTGGTGRFFHPIFAVKHKDFTDAAGGWIAYLAMVYDNQDGQTDAWASYGESSGMQYRYPTFGVPTFHMQLQRIAGVVEGRIYRSSVWSSWWTLESSNFDPVRVWVQDFNYRSNQSVITDIRWDYVRVNSADQIGWEDPVLP